MVFCRPTNKSKLYHFLRKNLLLSVQVYVLITPRSRPWSEFSESNTLRTPIRDRISSRQKVYKLVRTVYLSYVFYKRLNLTNLNLRVLWTVGNPNPKEV